MPSLCRRVRISWRVIETASHLGATSARAFLGLGGNETKFGGVDQFITNLYSAPILAQTIEPEHSQSSLSSAKQVGVGPIAGQHEQPSWGMPRGESRVMNEFFRSGFVPTFSLDRHKDHFIGGASREV